MALPWQLGKHFWPDFALVAGQRVDYLSPTVYVSDILIMLLFLVTLFQKQFHIQKSALLFLMAVILYMSIGIFFSQSPLNGWYNLLKLFELFFFGLVISQTGKKFIPFLFWAFFINVFLEGTLALLQFLHQASLGGMWYFLGERAFTAATPGIANASIHGQLILRPYATFPHPNVLAGYLVIALLFFLTCVVETKNKLQKFLASIALGFGSIILFLTLSRVAISVFAVVSFMYLFIRLKKYRMLTSIAYFLLPIAYLVTGFSGRFLEASSYTESLGLRDSLMQASWQMFTSHPLLGVGLGNFLVSLPNYTQGQLLFGFLQPVHTIFLLVLSETGIIGLGIFLLLLVIAFAKSFQNAKTNTVSLFSFLSLAAICLIGLTDHYSLTLQQGQLLLALVLGLCFSHATIALWPFTKNLQRTRFTK